MNFTINCERLDSPEATELIRELEAYIVPMYPHDDEHGLSPEEMVKAGVAFFVVRADGITAGCGGVRLFGIEYGEIVRMYVRPRFRGQGLGKMMLRHIEEYALAQGVRVLRLKTGIYQAEALGLYQRAGYRVIPAFGDYREHPLNMYYQKDL